MNASIHGHRRYAILLLCTLVTGGYAVSASAAPTNEVGCPPATGNTASAPSSSGSAPPPVYACTANNGFNPGVYNTNPNAPQPLSAFGLLGSMAQTQCAPATAPTASTASCNLTTAQAKNRVDYNFISAREGHLRTSGYVPVHSNGTIIGRSGVTIGIGVDLGQQTTAGLANEGVSPALIKTVKPYLGLKGPAARSYLNKHPLILTVQQAQALTTAAQTHIINTVASEYTTNSSPPLNFFQLPGGAQTAITDLAYQYGPNLAARTPVYWNQVIHGEWAAAVQNLNDFGDAYQTRRTLEANLIQGDINSGKLPASEGSCK